ncbi:hypothetical protein F0562_001785 [Nyssa sinensis]|uniref:Uncharacterized protein n=1 Tax=Nyssa sinensis TaxID=561372 RepID=A0A5J5C943_9ASTE|nr:hypothetical protein F0562_001785 [Nyssa sinensis]
MLQLRTAYFLVEASQKKWKEVATATSLLNFERNSLATELEAVKKNLSTANVEALITLMKHVEEVVEATANAQAKLKARVEKAGEDFMDIDYVKYL